MSGSRATTAGSCGASEGHDDPRSPDRIPEDERDYFLERRYPAFGNLVPRRRLARRLKVEVDKGQRFGPLERNGV